MRARLIEKRISNLREELGAAVLIVVTKSRRQEDIQRAVDTGQRDFGENRVGELAEKSLSFDQGIRWHFIGHLQSNKIKKLFCVRNLWAIHSVDSLKLLKKLLEKEETLEAPVGLFFQVNVSGETQKSGFTDWEELRKAHDFFGRQRPQKLYLIGLMGMGPRGGSSSFEKLRRWRDRLDKKLKLSMGMSGDYREALTVGTDFVRIGSLIFEA